MTLTCILNIAVVFPEVVTSEVSQSVTLPEKGVQVRLNLSKEIIRLKEPRVDFILDPRLSVCRVESSAQPVGQTDLRNSCK